jgi:hypothetical protein
VELFAVDTGPGLLCAPATVVAINAHILSVVFATLVRAGYNLPALPLRVLAVDAKIVVICPYHTHAVSIFSASQSFLNVSELLEPSGLNLLGLKKVRHHSFKGFVLIVLTLHWGIILARIKPKEIHKSLLLLLKKKLQNLIFLLF